MQTSGDIFKGCVRFWGWFFLYLIAFTLPAAFLGLGLRMFLGSAALAAGSVEFAADEPALVPIGFAAVAAALLATRRSCRKDGLSWSAAGLRRGRSAADMLLGVVIGVASFGLVLLAAAPGGWVSVRRSPAEPELLVSFLLSVLVLLPFAACEEITTRGVPFALIGRRSCRAAVAWTSVGFAALHIANPGASVTAFADVFLAGITLAVGRLRSGALWLPIGWHFGWNFAMGWLFGCEVSGSEPVAAPLFAARFDGPPSLVGGEFGPESGLLAFGANLAALVAFWRLYPTRPLLPPPELVASGPATDASTAE
jgi:membrane protease YdiL (CAAX protease family)